MLGIGDRILFNGFLIPTSGNIILSSWVKIITTVNRIIHSQNTITTKDYCYYIICRIAFNIS